MIKNVPKIQFRSLFDLMYCEVEGENVRRKLHHNVLTANYNLVRKSPNRRLEINAKEQLQNGQLASSFDSVICDEFVLLRQQNVTV